MNRKNTILIAVMVNAGLLVVLFITALTTHEEILSTPSVQMAEAAPPRAEISIEAPKPLFAEPAALRQTEEKPVAKAPEPPAAEAPVLHLLPPKAPEAPVATVQPPAPAAPAPQPVAVAPAPPAPPQAAPQAEFFVIIVKKGDSLDKLAKEHRTSVDAIIKINHLPSNFLRVGQQLKIPAGKTLPTVSKTKSVQVKEEGSPEYYTVKVGDNPWTIAMKHHIKVEELLRINGLNEEKARKLKPGDRLRTR